MKQLFYLLLVVSLFSCKKTVFNVDNEALFEYRYPADSLIEPKVFVYETNDSLSKLAFFVRRVEFEEDKKIYINVRLNHHNDVSERDSTVFYYRNKNLIIKNIYTLVWDWETNSEKVLEIQILDYFESPNKRVLKTNETSPVNEAIISTIVSIDTVVNKSTINILNHEVECMTVLSKTQQHTRYKLFPSKGRVFEKSGEKIYAKGIGLVYSSVTNHTFNTTYTTKLIEIVDYQTYLKKYAKNREFEPFRPGL